MASCSAAPTRCLRRRSSITANTQSARRRSRWQRPASRCAEGAPGLQRRIGRYFRASHPGLAAMKWLDAVNWNPDGLVLAIAQEADTGTVLTQAWMNREALERTATTLEAHYWSRSRRRLWRKGEASGHVQ